MAQHSLSWQALCFSTGEEQLEVRSLGVLGDLEVSVDNVDSACVCPIRRSGLFNVLHIWRMQRKRTKQGTVCPAVSGEDVLDVQGLFQEGAQQVGKDMETHAARYLKTLSTAKHPYITARLTLDLRGACLCDSASCQHTFCCTDRDNR